MHPVTILVALTMIASNNLHRTGCEHMLANKAAHWPDFRTWKSYLYYVMARRQFQFHVMTTGDSKALYMCCVGVSVWGLRAISHLSAALDGYPLHSDETLTLKQWCHSIYVTPCYDLQSPCLHSPLFTSVWPSASIQLLPSNCFHPTASIQLLLSNLLPSIFASIWADPIVGHIIGSFPLVQPSSTHLITSSCSMVPITVERRHEMQWKSVKNRFSNPTKSQIGWDQ